MGSALATMSTLLPGAPRLVDSECLFDPMHRLRFRRSRRGDQQPGHRPLHRRPEFAPATRHQPTHCDKLGPQAVHLGAESSALFGNSAANVTIGEAAADNLTQIR